MKMCLKTTVTIIVLALGVSEITSQDAATSKRPEDIIRLFYETLYGDSPIDRCPKLFYEPDVLAGSLPDSYKKVAGQDPSAVVWAFFRDRKQCLGFGGPEPRERARHARLGYLFTSYRSGAPFFEGGFAIVAIQTVSPGGNEGVRKQVVFPMQQSTSSDFLYLIEPVGITINGTLLDVGNKFDRSTDLWQLLGLQKSAP